MPLESPGYDSPCSCGVTGELSPSVVSPYVLAGDGSYTELRWSLVEEESP